MRFELDHAIRLLERTPAALEALLVGLPEAWLRATEGPDTFSPLDVVGHLVTGEEDDWVPRARRLLEHGPARPFEPFDRTAFRERHGGRSVRELTERFAALRAANLEYLRDLAASSPDLDAPGRHPELGDVILSELLSTWVVHDLSHLAQIARVLARQYGDAVGPWRAYLPILGSRNGE